jgi:hypothetical protein
VSKDDTIILDGDGDKQLIEDRCQIIREGVETTQSDYEKEKLQERLGINICTYEHIFMYVYISVHS